MKKFCFDNSEGIGTVQDCGLGVNAVWSEQPASSQITPSDWLA